MTEDKGQKFSCTNCGHTYVIFPPESGFDIMRLEPCEGEPQTHNKETRVTCEKCGIVKTIYWCPGHTYKISD